MAPRSVLTPQERSHVLGTELLEINVGYVFLVLNGSSDKNSNTIILNAEQQKLRCRVFPYFFFYVRFDY